MKYLLTSLPTSSFARAFTRSASALFQVKLGSSKYPETCKTSTSFLSAAARLAASAGEATKSMAVPWRHAACGLSSGTVFRRASSARRPPAGRHRARAGTARAAQRTLMDTSGSRAELVESGFHGLPDAFVRVIPLAGDGFCQEFFGTPVCQDRQ